MNKIFTRFLLPVCFWILVSPCRAQVSSSNQWTWIGGSQNANQYGHYGTKGVEDAANVPGARVGASSWVDSNDNLWLFGGYGYAASGSPGSLNDLWKYNTRTNAWTWASGDSVVKSPGKYGPLGGPQSPDNSIAPPARYNSAAGFYNGNNSVGGELVLFGGSSQDRNNISGVRNDLWIYYIKTNQWKWVSGDSTLNGTSNVVATGNASSPSFNPGNKPLARYLASAWVAGNVFSVYGGAANNGFLDDYWEFDLNGNLGGGWAAMYRNDPNPNVLFPSSQYWLNKPGWRVFANGFYDPASNHAYLFAGQGQESGTSYHSDLWQTTGAYSPTGYGEWRWIKGDSTTGSAGVYGSLGVAAPGNTPPSRANGAVARDIDGKFILFGGVFQQPGANNYFLNDIWAYDPSSNLWTWLAGGNATANSTGSYGTLGVQSPTNLITGRSSHIIWVTSKGELYVFGGARRNIGLVNDLWKFSAPLPVSGTDSLALVDLYKSAGGAQWKQNTNWLTSAPLSTWYGVGIQNGHVTSLVLDNNSLQGTLPASLANLSAFGMFSVSGNQLSGPVPAFGNIPALANGVFNISNNAFDYDGIEQLAKDHPLANYYPQGQVTIWHRGDTLSVSVGGTVANNTYAWVNNNTNLATVTGDSTFVATASGMYSVRVSNSVATQLVLFSHPLLVAGDTSIAAGCAYEVVRLAGSHCLPVRLSVDSALQPMTILWFRNDTLVRRVTASIQTGAVVAGGNGAGAAANQLNTPTGIWLDAQHNLYIADDSNRRVQKWAPGATSGTSVIGGGGSRPDYPIDLTGDPAGNLYVLSNFLNAGTSQVQKWAPGATSGTTIGQGSVEQYWGIARDAAGNIYLTDDYQSAVVKFAPGATQAVVVAGGNGPGDNWNQLGYPNGVAIDKQGSLFIADVSPTLTNGGRIVKWRPGAPAGVVLSGDLSNYYASTHLGFAYGIAVDGADNVYIADPIRHRVQCWAPGAAAVTVGDSSLVPPGSHPFTPFGVQVDDAGNVYAADEFNHRVLRFSRTIDHSYTDSLPGTYKAVLINASGCYYTSLPFVVERPVAPAIQSSRGDSLCLGDSLILRSSKAASYQWFNGANSLAGETGASLVVKSTGAYWVRAVDSLSCAATSAPTSVVVIPLPDKPVITRQDIVLVSSAAQGNQWFLNNVPIAGATDTRFAPFVKGNYSVMVTVNGCSGPMSDGFGYSLVGSSSLTSIYPNPARDVLTIVNNTIHPLSVQVCDMFGKTLKTITGLTGPYPLPISQYGTGMYVLYIVDPVTGRKEQKPFLKL